MIFARRANPDAYLPEDWDSAWARGWFRMRQHLFTTHFLGFDRQFYSAVWLRVDLSRWIRDKKFDQLRKLNKSFDIEFRRMDARGPRLEQELLYQKYRRSLEFEPAPTLRDLLFGEERRGVFPTWEVNLYDGDLIASGIFDVGGQAAGGIVCFYHPDYRKHSLGKYLIYAKMDWCRTRELDWFYPGYVAPGQPRFDYKLDLATEAIEYLELSTGLWRRLRPDSVPDPLRDMHDRLHVLTTVMDDHGVPARLVRYRHIDINLNPQVQGLGLFDYPLFVECFPGVSSIPALVIVHDPRDGQYHLLRCRSLHHFGGVGVEDGVFSSDLLVTEPTLVSSGDPEEMADWLTRIRIMA
jgi:arginine-tRNA-protein transferase